MNAERFPHESSVRIPRDLFFSGLVNLKRYSDSSFFLREDLGKMHSLNHWERLKVLGALKKAIVPLIESQLDHQGKEPVLSVGCGEGFLEEFLLPGWLLPRVVSFDISKFSLQKAQSRLENPLLQANIYQLPFASQSYEAILALSAYDSVFWLGDALAEAARCLKTGGKLITFQDCPPDLYHVMPVEPRTQETSWQAVERYHQKLITTVETNPDLKIIAGEKEFLEAVAVEPIGEVRKRVDYYWDEDSRPRTEPILSAHNIGSRALIPRSRLTRPLGSLIDRTQLLLGQMIVKPQEKFAFTPCGRDEMIEWSRLFYLVAEKI